jgi:DNA-binding NtrC family response regulator
MPKQRNYKPAVLSVGTLPELLSLREAVLRSAGYEVITTTEPQEADVRIKEGDCAVLLLCYSIGDMWREQLVRNFRKHCPDNRIVAITNQREPDTGTQPAVDDLVFGIEGAEALLDVIQKAVR